jgi:putative ABC transport system permease protein
MTALNRKLLRDFWHLRGQAVAIAFIVASGVGVFVMSMASMQALNESAIAYYERYRFADVFASAKRVPTRVVDRIADIPGVQAVEPRIVKLATVDVSGFPEPVIAALVSHPERREPVLNRLAIRSGRSLLPGNIDEVIVGEPFADAHGLQPGDRLQVLINGKRRQLEIVGVALSPEFVYAIGPGALMPDNRRYGVMWMNESALAAAYDLEEAFNDVVLSLWRGTDEADVIEALDALLDRYGGLGAYARADQISNWFVMNEIKQLKTLAGILPVIFFSVVIFLINMIMSRLVATERSEIGLLKAFGYRDAAIAWHYAKLVVAITAVGVLLGWLVGFWMGRYITIIYADFFRFPTLQFTVSGQVFLISALLSLTAALLGTVSAVRRAAGLQPSEAMRPAAPPLFHRARHLADGAASWLDQPTRIILRQVFRWPLRSLVTSFGIATAVGVLVMALQWMDAIDFMVEQYFFDQQRQDVAVGLAEARDEEVGRDISHLPGVLVVEPRRAVTAKIHHGHRWRRETVIGMPADGKLEVVKDAAGQVVTMPPQGIVLSSKLAELLEVGEGDQVSIQVLEGRRPLRSVTVARVFETLIGTPAYMHIDALSRLIGEPGSVNLLFLAIDEQRAPELFLKLKEVPAVSAVTRRLAAVDMFHSTMAETMLIYISFFAVFAGAMAFGVVYNSIRISLSERGRELATLRVLGFRRAEIAYILFGEAALLLLIGIPFGCGLGWLLAWLMGSAFETELYRVPLVIEPSTYAVAVIITLCAVAASVMFVWDRLNRLDLIAVLKTRE